MGRPVEQTVATYGYAPYDGALASVTDGAGRSTEYQLDDFGRLAKLTSASVPAGPVRFRYDARGNLRERKDAVVTVTYGYDGLDRMRSLSAARASDASAIVYGYTYDSPGKEGLLSTIEEPDRTVVFAYDAAGRLASETIQERGIPASLSTSYLRDADGAVTDVFYPSGLHVHFARDPATRAVSQVTNLSDGTDLATSIVHLPDGPLESMVFGNGLSLQRTFNRRHEPLAISSGPLALAYVMSPSGDVLSISQSDVTETYGYDFLDRLTSVSYDGAGASSAATVDGGPGTYTYAGDRVVSMRDGGGMSRFAYGYDDQGNVSGIGAYDATGTSMQAAVCLVHDALGRLTLAGEADPVSVSPGGRACTRESDVTLPIARFGYDARNRRVSRRDAAIAETRYTVADGSGRPLSDLLLVSDGSAATWVPLRDYVWVDDLPIGQLEYDGVPGDRRRYSFFHHSDHIGRPRRMTSSAGQTVWKTSASPYGDGAEEFVPDAASGLTVGTNLRLPSQYDERLLGSVALQGPYYNWNRWYVPGIGRYLELDPIALSGGFNSYFGPDWYTYGLANPLRNYDPDGRAVVVLAPWIIDALWAGGAALATCMATRTCPWHINPPSCSDASPWPRPYPRRSPIPVPVPPPPEKEKCEAHFNACWPILGMNQCRDCVARCIGRGGAWPFDQPECNYGQ